MTPQPDLIQSQSWFQRLTVQSVLAALALCFALFGLASGSILMTIATQDMSATQVAFNRVTIAAIVFALWNAIRAVTPKASDPIGQIGWREAGLLIAAGSSFAVFLVLLAWALAHTQVATATLLTHMMPIFTALGSWFLGKRFSGQFWLGLIVALAGAIAIGAGDLSLTPDTVLGDAAALLAAVFIAIEMLIVEQLRTRLATPTITMSECAIASGLVLPTLWLSGSEIFPPSLQSGLAVIAVAIVTQVIGHGLITYSLKQFSAGLISVALLAVPIIAAVLAMLLFGQMVQGWSAIAFVVVLIGIYCCVTASKVTEPDDPANSNSGFDSIG